MILTKPKSSKPTVPSSSSSSSPSTTTTIPPPPPSSLLPGGETSADDLEKDLERRLAKLGGNKNSNEDSKDIIINNDPSVQNTKEEKEVVENDILSSLEDSTCNTTNDNTNKASAPSPSTTTTVAAAVADTTAAADPVEKTKKSVPAPKKQNKSALLARIMAAQERAKETQIKQQSTSTISTKTPSSSTITTAPPPPPTFSETTRTINAEEERQKMMRALNGIVDEPLPTVKVEKKIHGSNFNPPSMSKPPPPPPPFSSQTLPPPAYPSQSLPPPSMPPPSFESFQQQQQQRRPTTVPLPPPPPPPSSQSIPPPAFDTIKNDFNHMSLAQAPSAPPSHASLMNNLYGIKPMIPPPPTYPNEQGMDDELFLEFDFDGNKMSAEERRKMMEEQRSIMEQIQKKSGENKPSEDTIRVNEFAGRLTGSNIQNPYENNTSSSRDITSDMNFASVNNDLLEEQRAIMEDIEKRKSQQCKPPPQVSSRSDVVAPTEHSVQIGNGQNAAIYGQEKTKEAIQDGTAMLVQCMNCDNWMQITSSATLMFCPICKTVSNVVKQDGVTYAALEKEKQMEEDRKLAERLQQEVDGEAESNSSRGDAYPGFSRSRNSNSVNSSNNGEGSWWDSLKSRVGMSSSTNEETKLNVDNDDNDRPGTTLFGVTTGADLHLQEENPSNASSSEGNRAGAGARSKPLLSSVVDSVTNAASAAATGASSMVYGDEHEINGVDTTSLLAIPNVGDDKD